MKFIRMHGRVIPIATDFAKASLGSASSHANLVNQSIAKGKQANRFFLKQSSLASSSKRFMSASDTWLGSKAADGMHKSIQFGLKSEHAGMRAVQAANGAKMAGRSSTIVSNLAKTSAVLAKYKIPHVALGVGVGYAGYRLLSSPKKGSK